MIVIASYWSARERAAEIDPCLIVSLMDPDSRYGISGGPSLVRHLRIAMHDVTDDDRLIEPYVLPNAEQVAQIIDLGQSWDGRGSVLIHCMAGVSRSAAAGLILLAARHPGRELEIARLLRERGPWLSPNPLMVRLADELLGRKGSLVAALARMGAPRLGEVGDVAILPNSV